MQPWTITHGFFAQMGGFMFCSDGRPIQVSETYNPSQAIDQIKAGVLDAPRITAAEIQDRSKGDFLSKAIVVIQTSWFVAQCIARWSARLPVTELEIVTLGFATLNALTYALWWNKPQSVGVPVYLERKKLRVDAEIQTDRIEEKPATGDNLEVAPLSTGSEPEKAIRKPRRVPKPPGPGRDIRHVKGSFLKQALKWEQEKNSGMGIIVENSVSRYPIRSSTSQQHNGLF